MTLDGNYIMPCAHLRHHGVCAGTVGGDDFRRRVGEAESQPCLLAGAGSAAKVYDGPAVLAGQPHHVAGLEVAVHVAQGMEVPHAHGQVVNHLQTRKNGFKIATLSS